MAKAKAKKKAPAAKVPAFPFFGAGDAHYFEWFEMFVWFAEPIPKSKRAAIVKMAPKLCQLDAQWPSDELLWASTGDQWIQQHLVDQYGTAKAKKKMADFQKKLAEDEEMSHWDGDTDEITAVGGEEQKFNQEIDAWLVKLNAVHPILLVVRGEDGEAGGTELSAWHKASLLQWPDIEPKLHAALTARKVKKDDRRVSALKIAAWYVGEDKLSAKTKALTKREED
ncbi:MAG: hypothetical protein QM831_16570 [Kofleriaceae bacterium]